MTDFEIMSAIGDDISFFDDRPTMERPKKSFLQRINERNQSFILQMRSKREDADLCDQRGQARSPTSTSKNFFKAPPILKTSKSSRNLADSLPSPVSPRSISPRPSIPDSKISIQQITAQLHRLSNEDLIPTRKSSLQRVDSTQSLACGNAFKLSPSQSLNDIKNVIRPRSSPSVMSDEQIEAWLEQPEDAEKHRKRKNSSGSTTSSLSSTSERKTITLEKLKSNIKEIVKTQTISSMSIEAPSEPFTIKTAEDIQDLQLWRVSTEFLMSLSLEDIASRNRVPASLCVLPDEVLREITRHVDSTSRCNLRLSCTRLHNIVPRSSPSYALQKR